MSFYCYGIPVHAAVVPPVATPPKRSPDELKLEQLEMDLASANDKLNSIDYLKRSAASQKASLLYEKEHIYSQLKRLEAAYLSYKKQFDVSQAKYNEFLHRMSNVDASLEEQKQAVAAITKQKSILEAKIRMEHARAEYEQLTGASLTPKMCPTVKKVPAFKEVPVVERVPVPPVSATSSKASHVNDRAAAQPNSVQNADNSKQDEAAGKGSPSDDSSSDDNSSRIKGKFTTLAGYVAELTKQRSEFSLPDHLGFDESYPVPTLKFSAENQAFLAYEKFLEEFLMKLDAFDSDGNDLIRETRRAVVRSAQREQQILDECKASLWSKAKSNMPDHAACESSADKCAGQCNAKSCSDKWAGQCSAKSCSDKCTGQCNAKSCSDKCGTVSGTGSCAGQCKAEADENATQQDCTGNCTSRCEADENSTQQGCTGNCAGQCKAKADEAGTEQPENTEVSAPSTEKDSAGSAERSSTPETNGRIVADPVNTETKSNNPLNEASTREASTNEASADHTTTNEASANDATHNDSDIVFVTIESEDEDDQE